MSILTPKNWNPPPPFSSDAYVKLCIKTSKGLLINNFFKPELSLDAYVSIL